MKLYYRENMSSLFLVKMTNHIGFGRLKKGFL